MILVQQYYKYLILATIPQLLLMMFSVLQNSLHIFKWKWYPIFEINTNL